MKAISKAMVLAAGRGTRMLPLTKHCPKSLVKIAGRALIDHVLRRLFDAGIKSVVVNIHHLSNKLQNHLNRRRGVLISLEPELLETGGGVKYALDHFGRDPFLVVNSDIIWFDGEVPALTRLMEAWSDDEMDALLLLYPTKNIKNYSGQGDYGLDRNGRAFQCKAEVPAPYLFTGVQVLHPRLFECAPSDPFSLKLLYDTAEQVNRLHAIVHDGKWFHVGTEQELTCVKKGLRTILCNIL